MKTPLLSLLLVAICTVPLSAIDLAPRVISRVVPVYPFECRKAQVEGEVQVTFIVTARGKVTHARVDQATHPGFAEAALAAVRKWQFRPGEEDDRVVETQVTQRIRFVTPKPLHTGVAARR